MLETGHDLPGNANHFVVHIFKVVVHKLSARHNAEKHSCFICKGRSKGKTRRGRKKGRTRSNSSAQAIESSEEQSSNTQPKVSSVLKNLPLSSVAADKVLAVLTKAKKQQTNAKERKPRRSHTLRNQESKVIRGTKVRSSNENSTSPERWQRSTVKRRRTQSSSPSEEHSSIAKSVTERRRATAVVYKARKSARITRSTPIVTISEDSDSETKQRRMNAALRKLGVSESTQARIKESVATLKKIPNVPKKKPRGKSGSSSCSGTCSSSDSGNVSKSKCSTCDSDSSDVKFPNGSRKRKGTPRILSDESSDSEQSKRGKRGNMKIDDIDLIVMHSGDENSRKKNRSDVREKLSALDKLGISKNTQDKIRASVIKINKENSKTIVSSQLKRKQHEKSERIPNVPKSKPGGKSDSSSCSGTCSSSDSVNVSKSKCSTCDSDSSYVKFPNGSRKRKGTPRILSDDESSDSEQSKGGKGQSSSDESSQKQNHSIVREKLSALDKLGISKNTRDKILASVTKINEENNKTMASSMLKRKQKEKSTVKNNYFRSGVSKPSSFATLWRSTPCDSSSSSDNSCNSHCTLHTGQSSSACTCSGSHTGNTHTCCSSVESVSCEESTVHGQRMVTVGGNFELSRGIKSKLRGNKDGTAGVPPLIVIE